MPLRQTAAAKGDALGANVLAQISGCDFSIFPDFDRSDIGADRNDPVGDGFRQQRARVFDCPHDRSVRNRR
ncbi:hypothetical protein ASC80_16355 [Afipia sp. Root123D2]|nr:hypothetical protein ASC80_16355 [Afipia sp. Root123D2]